MKIISFETRNPLVPSYMDKDYLIIMMKRAFLDEYIDIHICSESVKEHFKSCKILISSEEDEAHNGFAVYGNRYLRFSPCKYDLDNPYNRLVFKNKYCTNWISNDEYSEDSLFCVQLIKEYCEGGLCVATALNSADPICSPQIIISGKSIAQLTFAELLQLFNLKKPNGASIKEEEIANISVSFWEKKFDYVLENC